MYCLEYIKDILQRLATNKDLFDDIEGETDPQEMFNQLSAIAVYVNNLETKCRLWMTK